MSTNTKFMFIFLVWPKPFLPTSMMVAIGPVGISFEECGHVWRRRKTFHRLVRWNLARHFSVIKAWRIKVPTFFDYGVMLFETVTTLVSRKFKNGLDDKDGHLISYVEDIMDGVSDYGYGPFSLGLPSAVNEDLIANRPCSSWDRSKSPSPLRPRQLQLIRDAERTNWWLQASYPYQDCYRVNIALKFNELICQGKIGPVDVPPRRIWYRCPSVKPPISRMVRTSLCDMAVHRYAGNATAAWVRCSPQRWCTGIGKSYQRRIWACLRRYNGSMNHQARHCLGH